MENSPHHPFDEVILSEDHDAFKWIDHEEYERSGLIENLFPAFAAS